MSNASAIELKNITKNFGNVIANNNVSLTVRRGEIMALLGENGSGKTTLMNMLSGIYFPDSGTITVEGREVTIRSPKDAFDLGIGMVHQHFKLVDVFTAAENIVLGLTGKSKLNRKAIADEVTAISKKYGFVLDPNRKIYDMSVSEKQTAEIIKVLYRGANILILDEPTAVLTPQETNKLFEVLRNMKKDGKAIIIITHKLNEVMAISDKVAVLRKGEYIDTVNTCETNPQQLTDMMVGHAVSLNIDRPKGEKLTKRLDVKDVSCVSDEGVNVLEKVSFTAFGGEILGVAGIAGSGQKELCEAIAGLQHLTAGSILYHSGENGNVNVDDLVGKNPMDIRQMGISLAFVPEDRLGMGLVADMGMVDNMMLRSYRKGNSAFADRRLPKSLAEDVRSKLKVVTPGINTPVRQLSGGNVQKVLLGREIASSPTVIMAAYPVRGLDINSSYTIYNLLNEQKAKGVAVMYIGEDLDVLLELCDRILVLCGGKVSGIVDGRTATKEQIGLMMTHISQEEGTANE
ncbi:MAG: ABC transporter ATP-binding protein [Anaerotignaceae bacterium]